MVVHFLGFERHATHESERLTIKYVFERSELILSKINPFRNYMKKWAKIYLFNTTKLKNQRKLTFLEKYSKTGEKRGISHIQDKI